MKNILKIPIYFYSLCDRFEHHRQQLHKDANEFYMILMRMNVFLIK